jgi:UDP-2-acetamido-3-amino-2,3-dideoxy-glucuronate N-acetyltransferase
MTGVFIHPNAIVERNVTLGSATKIWEWTKIREGAVIGSMCNIGQGCYIDTNVKIGDRCKIQNGVSIYRGVTLGDDVFVGPGATFTNDRVPRADNAEWPITKTSVENGASVGANSTIICGVSLGERCMIAAGAIVTRDVPRHALVAGGPARIIDWVAKDGRRLGRDPAGPPPTDDDLSAGDR